MKRYDPRRADRRPIEEQALGFIYAMDDAAALCLHARLKEMAGDAKTPGKQRAAMFVGVPEGAA